MKDGNWASRKAEPDASAVTGVGFHLQSTPQVDGPGLHIGKAVSVPGRTGRIEALAIISDDQLNVTLGGAEFNVHPFR